MENTSITRPMNTSRRTPAPSARAHVTRPIATSRPQTQERTTDLARPTLGAASNSSRPTGRSTRPATGAATNLPANGLTNRSRQTPAQQPSEKPAPVSRNFSRPQAAPLATRQPATGSQRVGQIGAEDWACRHESVAALPQPARGSDYARAGIVRSFRGRALSVEDQRSSHRLSGGESLATVSEDHQTAVVRWQDAAEKPQTVRGAAIPSQAASLVAPTATESVSPSVAVMRVRPLRPGQRLAQNQQLLAPSPLRSAPPAAVEGTYLEMQPRFSRAPTRLPPSWRGPAMDESWGENFSRFSPGTTVRDIERRRDLATKFPLPGNAAAGGSGRRERRFAGEAFVDAPVRIGGGGRTGTLIERINELKEQGLRERIDGVREQSAAAACALGNREGDEAAAEKGQAKGRWRRISGFFARKLGQKGRDGSSSLDTESSSPQAAGSTPSLVRGSSSEEALSPVTPAAVEAERLVAVVEAPAVHRERIWASRASSPILSPAMQAPLQTTTVASLATSESEPELAELEDPAATALALRREYDELLPASRQEEEEEAPEDAEAASPSPLQALDFELFPSHFATSERWALAERARDSAFHEAVVEAVAEAVAKEEAAVDWSVSQSEVSHGEAVAVTIAGEEAMADRLEEQGVIARAQSLRTARKGKAKAIEVPAVRSRYASVRRGIVGLAPEAGQGEAAGCGGAGNVVGNEDGKGDGQGDRRFMVVFSGLRP